MADDFYTRLNATLASIPKPPPPDQKLKQPEQPLTAAAFLWRIFRTDYPSPNDVREAKQALRRCLQGSEGLGWLIWDQAAGWAGWSQILERDFRNLIRAHPPWESRQNPEARRLANWRTNKARDMSLDQRRIRMMQSRIRQALSKCYDAPRSSPRWETLIRHTGASKATRLKIMKKAVAGRLIPEITTAMLNTLERTEQDQQERQQEQHNSLQKRRLKRAQRLQRKEEEAWIRHRRQSRGIEK